MELLIEMYEHCKKLFKVSFQDFLSYFFQSLYQKETQLEVLPWSCPKKTAMGPVRIRHSSHDFGWQSSHSVDLAGWQAKMASIEIWIP